MLDADLLVAGGGPVGLGTAIAAALAGLRVTVVEPRPDPVDKACGEGLLPGALAALGRLGVAPAGMPLAGIRYLDGSRAAQAPFRDGGGLGVRRLALHAALAARADELGVRRVAGRVERVRQDPVSVQAEVVRAGQLLGAGPVPAGLPQSLGPAPASLLRVSWLVAADGLHSPLRAALGLTRPAAGRVRFGLRRHYQVSPWTDHVEVYWAGDAEAYVTPVGPDLVGVAVLCAGGAPYDAWLARFPRLQHRLGAAGPATRVRGAGPLRQRARGRVRGRVLLVGDAAGYVDALTGEGVAVGLAGADALVACLLAGRPQDYEAAWRRATRRYRALTGGLLWATSHPSVRARLVPAAARLPGAFRVAVRALE